MQGPFALLLFFICEVRLDDDNDSSSHDESHHIVLQCQKEKKRHWFFISCLLGSGRALGDCAELMCSEIGIFLPCRPLCYTPD